MMEKPHLILICSDPVVYTVTAIDWRSGRNFISVLGLHHRSHNYCGECVELSVSHRFNFEDA